MWKAPSRVGDPRCAPSCQWQTRGALPRSQGRQLASCSPEPVRGLKKTREETLRRGRQADWADELILDKDGKIVANLANVTLILREAPEWKGVLGYDEFTARVVIRQHPPWGAEPSDSPWTDHHDSSTRVWFQRKDISPAAGDVGRAVQAAAQMHANSIRYVITSMRSSGMAHPR